MTCVHVNARCHLGTHWTRLCSWVLYFLALRALANLITNRGTSEVPLLQDMQLWRPAPESCSGMWPAGRVFGKMELGMTGSFLVPIIVPIVAFITLAAWLGMVYWADANPGWDKGESPEAVHPEAAAAILDPAAESIAASVAGAIGQRDEEYRKARLVLEQTQAQVNGIEERTHTTTTIAQQFLLVDVAIVGIMAAAALAVEQISLQLTQRYNNHVPAGDVALTRGGLIGLGILAFGAALSGCFAAWCFLGERSRTTELGPDPRALATAASAAEQAVQAALVLQGPARTAAVLGLRDARWRLLAAVVVLSLGVLAGFLTAVLIWQL